MSLKTFLLLTALSFLPISELRGGIPFALWNGMSPLLSFLYCTFINALVAPLAWIFLSSIHKGLYHWRFYRGIFDHFVERAREKVHPKVEKYGYWGLMVFVAIPFPLTGAWTGVLGGWMLGMEPKKVIGATVLGVLIAGLVVSFVLYFGVGAFSFFIKSV
jgi:uncharacterized membrane protein